MVDPNSKIIEAANLPLALLAVFVYATHATQSIALRALRLDGNRASDSDAYYFVEG